MHLVSGGYLCATMIVVRPVSSLSSASCTSASLSLSRAEVASSSSRILGFLTGNRIYIAVIPDIELRT